MSEPATQHTPWLTIIGIGEDGLAGLPDASRSALAQAEIVFGAPRHLALADVCGDHARPWPVPFSIAPLLAERGRAVVVLASGDPFWFGVGGTLARHLEPHEWRVHPGASVFSLVAARLGWRLEEMICLGLHAAPFARLFPLLAPGQRIVVTLRDGNAARDLAAWLVKVGFGAAQLHLMEAMGGPDERISHHRADTFTDAFPEPGTIAHPVAAAIEPLGSAGLPRASGLPDDEFAHDGQITKRPVRALTLSALAPRPGEVLWDIGGGSGSVSVEFLLSAARTTAHAIEPRADRAARIRTNAERFGLSHRLAVTKGRAPAAFADLPDPDVVFLGGGASDALLTALVAHVRPGTRLVANAVTIETEALLTDWSARRGGELLRIALSQVTPLGPKRGWRAALPVVQWSVTL